MKRVLPLLCIFAALADLTRVCYSAPDRSVPLSQYVHEFWQRRQGLPQDSATTLLQSRDGFLWLGTQEGLVRFDGIRFTLYNRSNTPAFPHNEVTALSEGPDGTLWIGTYGGLLELREGRFTAHPAGRNRQKDAITSLAVEAGGAVWIGTQGGGVNRFERGSFEFHTVSEGLASDVVADVAVGRNNDVFVATSSGVSIRRTGHWTSYGKSAGMPSTEAWQVVPAPDGGVWIGTARGLARFDGRTVTAPPQPREVSGASLRAVGLERTGALWLGTDSGVAWRWDGTSWSSLELSENTPGNTVLAVAEDREGCVWIGTYVTGVHRLWRGRFTNLTRKDGLPDNGVRTILHARDGSAWVASEGAGISRISGNSVTNYGVAAGLPNLVARALFEDRDGIIWAGTRGGLCKFDKGRFHVIPSTAGLSVRALATDSLGTLWVGVSTRGVFRLVGDRLTDLAEDGRTRLPQGVVRCIVRDNSGAMWVGTDDALARWYRGTLTTFGVRDGFPGHATYTVYQDREGVLWLGSYGGGLARLKEGKVTQFTQAVGLFDDVVYQILEDDGGNFWISCNNGIYSVAKSQLDSLADGRLRRIRCVSYDETDGMLSRECNGNSQPAGARSKDGRLWFPTTAGVVIVDPADLGKSMQPPLVAIERVVANGMEISAGNEAVVPPGPGRVELEYTGISFIAPRRLGFHYRLEGQESEWQDAGSRRQIVYANLDPGRYVFHVRAHSDEGVLSESDAVFAFELQPHFYQTIWFRGLYILAGAGLLMGVLRLRVWQHVRRERELARRVESALGRIKMLSGLIPICANCKKIRDDRGYWSHLEQYLKAHSEAVLSHGLCPECIATLYPGYVAESDDTSGGPKGA
jgi:ligand-binding sensor domain-containing protein